MVIDFRVRPPFRSFRRFFHPHLDPAIDDDAALEAFIAELDAAGIGKAVVMGRHVPAEAGPIVSTIVENDDIEAIVRRHPDRFVGFGSVDVRNVAAALEAIDRLAGRGFRGVAFDNPLSVPARYDDDPALFPIYERARSHGLIVALTASGLVGRCIDYSHPRHVQAVANAFPDLPVIVPHACWPWTEAATGALLQTFLQQTGRLYLMPDLYLHTAAPGRHAYIDALRWSDVGGWTGAGAGLETRFLFASSHPLQSPGTALRSFLDLGLAPDVNLAVLERNALGLLHG